MNIKNIKMGMMVRVHSDISKTQSRWTLDENGYMLKMREKIHKVNNIDISRNGVTLDDTNHDEDWIFSSEDLSMPSETKPMPPVMFDPKNLEVT